MSKTKIGQFGLGTIESALIGSQHSPVVISFKVIDGVEQLKAGTLMGVDATTFMAKPYSAGDKLIGVLTLDCDLAQEETANILVHGAVKKERLILAEDTPLSSENLIDLIQQGIFPL
jgi:hypothetical protein